MSAKPYIIPDYMQLGLVKVAVQLSPAAMGALLGGGGLAGVQLLRRMLQSKEDRERNGAPSILNGALLGAGLGGLGGHFLGRSGSEGAAALAPSVGTLQRPLGLEEASGGTAEAIARLQAGQAGIPRAIPSMGQPAMPGTLQATPEMMLNGLVPQSGVSLADLLRSAEQQMRPDAGPLQGHAAGMMTQSVPMNPLTGTPAAPPSPIQPRFDSLMPEVGTLN